MRVRYGARRTAAFVAAVFLLGAAVLWLLLPPRHRETSGAAAGMWTGAFHVHTRASDGGGTRDDVAGAAAAAGLQFVIITDHGDGTRPPAPPEYLHGVLVIDGVEVSTWDGHYAAFGQQGPAPYPLGGPAASVVEDIERLGGFGVAAHPHSAKPDLRWRAETPLPVHAIEVLNGDSAWRDEGAWRLARTFLTYPLRPAEALAALVDHPQAEVRMLVEANRLRRTVALAGADAHGRLPLSYDDDGRDGERGAGVAIPSYEQVFRALTNVVEVGAVPTGRALEDAGVLMRAMRLGRVTAAVSGLASPGGMQFTATGDTGRVATMGDRVSPAPMTFAARTPDVLRGSASDVRLRLFRDDRVIVERDGAEFSHHVPAADSAGVWRVQAHLASSPEAPWLIGSPIVVVSPDWGVPGFGTRRFADAAAELTSGSWVIEKHDASHGAVGVSEQGLRFEYALAAGTPSGQYAAAVRDVPGGGGWTHLVVRASAPEPTRVWVQLRVDGAVPEQRWGRSIYLDRHASELTLALDEFRPLEPGLPGGRLDGATPLRAVLVVVDTVNSAPGRRGSVQIERLALERR